MNRGGLTLAAVAEDWPLARPFVISRSARTQARVVTLSVDDGQARGYGECQPNSRYGETAEEVIEQLNALDGRFGSVDALRAVAPASRAARNALDCALWDLAAKRRGCRVWDLLGLDAPGDIVTAVTVSLGPPDTMARHAAELVAGGARLLKLKLGGDGDMARVRAVRAAAPDVRLVADANESWTPDMLAPNLAAMAACGVELLEQPLPADADDALAGLDRPLPVCADESCLDVDSLPRLVGRYDAVNVKLDKTGGADTRPGSVARGAKSRPENHDRLHARNLACHGTGPSSGGLGRLGGH